MGDKHKGELSLEMVLAGVAAFRRWNPDAEEPAALVVEVYYAMQKAMSATPEVPAQSQIQDCGCQRTKPSNE